MKEKVFGGVLFEGERFGDYVSRNFVLLEECLSVKEAMRRLVARAGECEEIDVLFVADAAGRYRGAIELKRLITAREGTPLVSLMNCDYPFVFAERPVDENIEQLREFVGGTLPVLDAEYHQIGIISVERIVKILDEEYGEDYARLAGLTEEEDLQESLLQSMKKRLPWLGILLALGLLISSVIGVFEGVIERLTVIVCFQSMILGMAGNGGTQSLAVTVRLLNGGALSRNDRRRLVNKELGIGLADGGILALLSFAGIGIYLCVAGESALFAFAVGGCIGGALWCAMVISAAAGTLIPLLLNAFGFDPAVAGGPLITTLNDLSSVVIYYGLAWLFLIRIAGFGA